MKGHRDFDCRFNAPTLSRFNEKPGSKIDPGFSSFYPAGAV